MMEQQRQSHSSVAPSKRDDSTYSDTTRAGESVPASIEIDLDLELDPVAYHYESWSEMADGWVESLRSSVETMPDSNHEQIRNVTPLVPLSDVEALIERLVLSGEVAISHARVDARDDTFLP